MCGLFGKKKDGELKTFEMLQEFRGETGDGRQLLIEKRYEDALKYFDERLKEYPRSAYYKEGKALALFELGNYKEAMKYYDGIIQTFDEYLKTYWLNSADLFDITFRSLYQKAWLSDKSGVEDGIQLCYEKAMQCINSLIDLSSKQPYSSYPNRLWLFKARVHTALQQYDEAIENLKKTIEIQKTNNLQEWDKFKEYLLGIPEFQELKNDPRFKALVS
jgi:tetratricopeptide (TPR) repeat protein